MQTWDGLQETAHVLDDTIDPMVLMQGDALGDGARKELPQVVKTTIVSLVIAAYREDFCPFDGQQA